MSLKDSFREHRASLMDWMSYKATKVHGDVTEQLVAANAVDISERREYVRCIVSVIIFLAKQGIAFRGHSEGEDNSNQGNFSKCIKPSLPTAVQSSGQFHIL